MNSLDQAVNPYIAGSPVTGAEMFFGRRDVFEFIGQTLSGKHRDQIIVLYGQRRTGKTSVLYQMHRHLTERYIPIFIDLHGLALRGVDGFLWELANHIRRGLRRDHDITLPALDRETFLADAREQFADVFLNQVWQTIGDRHLLLMLDEAIRLQEQVTAKQMEPQVFEYVRHLMQHYPRLNFLFSLGSGLEEMEKNYALLFNVALYKKISFLARDEAVELITRPAADHYRLEPVAVDHILGLTSGHPYYTQLICHSLFNRWQSTRTESLSVADVNAILEEVVERGLAVLKYVWEESDPAERAVMAGLAQAMGEQNRPVSLAAVARSWADQGVALPEGQMNRAVKSLIARDVIAGRDRYAFTVALQQMWVRQYERIEWVKEEIAEERAGWAVALDEAAAEPLPLESGVMRAPPKTEPKPAERPGRRISRRALLTVAGVAAIAIVAVLIWLLNALAETDFGGVGRPVEQTVAIQLNPADRAALEGLPDPIIEPAVAVISGTALFPPNAVYLEPLGVEQPLPGQSFEGVRLEVPEGYVLVRPEQVAVYIGDERRFEVVSFPLLVAVENLGPGLTAILDPPEVIVSLVGLEASGQEAENLAISAVVDVAELEPGVHQIPIDIVASLPSEVTVVGVEPSMAAVQLTAVEGAERPLVPVGEAAQVNRLLSLGDFVWAATDGGLVRWGPDLEGALFDATGLGLPDNCVQSIGAVPSGDGLWLGCGGLAKALVDSEGVPRFEEYFDRDDGLTLGVVRAMMVDVDGAVWAGGPGAGADMPLAYFDGRQWNDQPLPLDPTLEGVDFSVQSLLHDAAANIWIGLERDGILHYDGQWTHYDLADIGSRNGDDFRIRSLIQTANGDIWAAASDRGLLVLPEDGASWQREPLPIDAPARAVLELSSGQLVATGDFGGDIGFVAISAEGGGSWELLAGEDERVGADAGGLAQGADGRIWVGSYVQGVSVFDGQGWTHLQR